MPRRVDPIRRADAHARIQTAAETLFAERGFDATTVDDIVDAAGVSKPALYRSFASKEHLYCELLDTYARRLADTAMRAVASPGPTDDPVRHMIDRWFAEAEQRPAMMRILASNASPTDAIAEVRATIRSLQIANDATLIRRLAPSIPEEGVAPLSEAIHGALIALAMWWLDQPNTPRRVPVDAMTRICRGLIATAE